MENNEISIMVFVRVFSKDLQNQIQSLQGYNRFALKNS